MRGCPKSVRGSRCSNDARNGPVLALECPLVIDGDRALHKKRLDVVGVEHDLLELLDRVPP